MTTTIPDLWPHQRAAIDSTVLAIEAGLRSGLLVIPTGGGKTATVMTLGRRLGLPMLFLVHRDRLVQQTEAAAARFWPEASVGVIQADRDEWEETLFEGPPTLVIGAVQSLHERRLARIPRDRFAIVVCDEAHHAPAPQWKRILEHFRPDFRLGVTATPQRLDKIGLDGFFGRDPLYSYSIFQAIADGVLCPVQSLSIETRIDLSKVESVSDFKLSQLARVVNAPSRNAQVVEAYAEHAIDRRAIAFCVDVAHCEDLAQAFADHGFKAAAVHSKSVDDPDELLDAFAAGKLDVLTSCEVLTEGFDDPGVSCILMARPTMSRALYIQMVGRGLRRAEGKADCLVIDFTDNHKEHKLACSIDLFGKKKDVRQRAAALETPENKDRPELPDVPLLSWKAAESCPWPAMPTLDDYVPLFPWDDQPATPPQLKYLQSFGVKVSQKLTKGEASHLIDRCKEYEATFPRPATPNQRYVLEQAGLWQEGMGKRQASVLIANLKKRAAS